MNATPRRMVALILGQSNVANHGPVRAPGHPGVFVLTGTGIVPAADPLPGASGDGGSVWMRFAPTLIEKGLFDEVVLVPVAQGGTAVADWARGGACHLLMMRALEHIAAAGLAVSHVFWHQGERDTLLKTGGCVYRDGLASVVSALRERGIDAPIVICTASYRFGAVNDEVRAVQRDVADSVPGLIAGPDTDTLGPEWRYDDCHFTAEGQARFADMLIDCLRVRAPGPNSASA